jgi:hypothetical protein
MKEPTLHDLMKHHEPTARRLAEQYELGPIQSRSYEGRPRDAGRTAVVRFTFLHGSVTYDGNDYHVERTTPTA